MVTVALVLVALVLAVAAGEFVRGQCRRMLSRPAYGTNPTQSAAPSAVPEPVMGPAMETASVA